VWKSCGAFGGNFELTIGQKALENGRLRMAQTKALPRRRQGVPEGEGFGKNVPR
jgi:hypothetical protein